MEYRMCDLTTATAVLSLHSITAAGGVLVAHRLVDEESQDNLFYSSSTVRHSKMVACDGVAFAAAAPLRSNNSRTVPKTSAATFDIIKTRKLGT